MDYLVKSRREMYSHAGLRKVNDKRYAARRVIMNGTAFFIGIDVQIKRRCPFAVLDSRGNPFESGWSDDCNDFLKLADRLANRDRTRVCIGIDAPRIPLESKREWYWEGGKRKRWRTSRASDKGNGRHCEVIFKAHGIANPQWTPCRKPYPNWIEFGFSLYSDLHDFPHVYEVFPSASYRILNNDPSVKLTMHLRDFAEGPKDMLDAYVSAFTVFEFLNGRGQSVGGGDGYGEINFATTYSKPN